MAEQKVEGTAVHSENFRAEVLQRSRSLPVVVLFWADQHQASVQARALLERLVAQYANKLALATVDVAQDQMLVRSLGIRVLPSIRVFHKEAIAGQIDGPVDEQSLRSILDELTMTSSERVRAALAPLLAKERFEEALRLVRQALRKEPGNLALQVETADLLLLLQRTKEARKLIASIPEDAPERGRPLARLRFMDEAADLPATSTIVADLDTQPRDPDLLYAMAVRDMVARKYRSALEHLLTMVQVDRAHRDRLGQRALLQVFEVLGPSSPLTAEYRRKLFSLLH